MTLSNPCFEVWLYYHKYPKKPEDIKNIEKCSTWKQYVNDSFSGGFDSRRHPLYIEKALINAEKNFTMTDGLPDVGCTEVYNLANSILPFVKEKLEKVISQVESSASKH